MMSAQRRPQHLKALPYARLRSQLRTGDLVLFSGRTLAARLVRWWTGSPWSHIGIVIRLPEYADTPLLWEATRANTVDDIHRGRRLDGVQLVALDAKLASYPGEVAVRRLLGTEGNRERSLRIEGMLADWSDQPYRNIVKKQLEALWRGQGHAALHISRGGFCSELVAEVYQQLRLLPQDKPAHNYVPSDFGPETPLPLLQGRLSPAYLLNI
jgi:hypothetical protein